MELLKFIYLFKVERNRFHINPLTHVLDYIQKKIEHFDTSGVFLFIFNAIIIAFIVFMFFLKIYSNIINDN